LHKKHKWDFVFFYYHPHGLGDTISVYGTPDNAAKLTHKSKRGKNIEKRKIKKKHSTRRKIACHESNKKYIKNLSNI